MASTGFGPSFRHLRGLFEGRSAATLEDGQLLARYEADRDEAAFEALLTRHGPMVLTTCRAVLKNEHDVEDAFQATFLVLANKARSIRGTDALGGWLHRVAYRASVQAGSEASRRRQKEAEASEMVPKTSTPPDLELAAILHEEIDRLPESQRLPVVLCDLEGLSYDQAARQLRWTVPTLRNRLARARQRLKVRLIRRGVTPSAIGVLLASKASAAVPPALMRSTISAATGGATSGGAALLAHTLLRGMLVTKLKIASTAALAALALASAGLIAAGAGAGRPGNPRPAPRPRLEARAEVVQEAPASRKPSEMVEVRGRVVAPDGQPVAGASVRGAYHLDGEAGTVAGPSSGADGRFAIRLPRSSGPDPLVDYDRYPRVLATAPGFGVGWVERALRANRPDEQVVRLVEKGPPIEGRIVDLEGRPVAGARVEVARIFFEPGDDLAGWIARARDGTVTSLWQGLEGLNVGVDRIVPMAARTGADGRFTLAGIGRDRVAELIVSGPGVATTRANVLVRDGQEIRSVARNFMKPMPFLVHAPRFQLALAPSRRVEGVARDKDSGEPIAGLVIKAGDFDDPFRGPAEGVEARTDAGGRYRLDGLPIAPAYRLFPTPRPALPYTNGALRVPADSPTPGPVTFDFALKRGVVVRGKVTDKVTGAPVRGNVFFMALADNRHVAEFPGFSQTIDFQYAHVQDDGRYEIVALPGPGLLAVINFENRYRSATGLEAIRGYEDGMFITATAPIPASGYNLFVATDLDPKAESATVDLRLDPGRSLTIEVVGPDGRPLGGTKVRGIGDNARKPSGDAIESASFEVHALDPSKPRRVVVAHEGRKLIGSAFLKGDEVGPVVVGLRPWGTVVGRVVDAEGQPRKEISLTGRDRVRLKHPETQEILPDSNRILLDADARFRIEGLVPGLEYSGSALSQFRVIGDLFQDVTVAPGEVKDLGDLKVRPFPPERE